MAGLVQESDQANSHTHHSHHVKFSLQVKKIENK